MPKFRVSVTRTETYAEIEVEAKDEQEARAKATTAEALNAAAWEVSEGNYIRPDSCEVFACDPVE